MKKVLGIVLGVVLVLAVLGLSFYAGTKYANLENKKEEENGQVLEGDPKTVEEKEPELVGFEDPLVKDASSLIPSLMCHGYALKLENKDRTLKDFTDNEKLSMVASYFAGKLDFEDSDDEEYTGEVHKEVKESDVKKLFEDTSFLKTLTKSKEDNMVGLGYKGFYYDFKDKKYYANIIATGCVADEYEDDYLQLFQAKKTDKTLVLDYSYAYLSTKYNEKKDIFVNNLYKSEGDKTPLVKNASMDDEGDFDTDWSLFNHYEFVFDITNNNLRLTKINFIEVK